MTESTAKYQVSLLSWGQQDSDNTKLELLWRVRVETTRNHCRRMQDRSEMEEDAARWEVQRAYFAGAARAWELAGDELNKVLSL